MTTTSTPYVQTYREVTKALVKEGSYSNLHAAPRLEKIVVSIGIGKHMQKSKDYSFFEKNLQLITGQKPVVKKSKKAISNFKLRAGMPVSVMVTLRGKRMYGFLSKFVNVVLPRVRDFRGLSLRSFDGTGNYSIGLSEQTVFPEVHQDDSLTLHGIQITLTTTAQNDDQGKEFLRKLGLPFQK